MSTGSANRFLSCFLLASHQAFFSGPKGPVCQYWLQRTCEATEPLQWIRILPGVARRRCGKVASAKKLPPRVFGTGFSSLNQSTYCGWTKSTPGTSWDWWLVPVRRLHPPRPVRSGVCPCMCGQKATLLAVGWSWTHLIGNLNSHCKDSSTGTMPPMAPLFYAAHA